MLLEVAHEVEIVVSQEDTEISVWLGPGPRDEYMQGPDFGEVLAEVLYDVWCAIDKLQEDEDAQEESASD
jgi:hypothetical protein